MAWVLSSPYAPRRSAVIPAPAYFVHPPLGFIPIGQPLLPGTLDGRIAIEVAWGADLTDTSGASWTWSDVTADVMYEQRVSIARGRADETSQASPASCSFTLLNLTGNYTAYNPTGSHYPYVRKGTPVRVRVDPGTGMATVRFQGYAAEWTPAWDTSANLAVVNVVASGSLRRLTQGSTPLRSAMYRQITLSGLTGLVGYWPLEDDTSATRAAAGLVGGTTLAAAGTVSFAGVAGPVGSDQVVDLTAGRLYGTTQTSSIIALNPSYRVDFAFQHAGLGAGSADIVDWWTASGGNYLWSVILQPVGSGGLTIQWQGGGATGVYASNVAVDDGVWHHVSVRVTSSVGSAAATVYLDGVSVISTGSVVSFVQIDRIQVANAPLAHLAVWKNNAGPSVANCYSAFGGWAGETASARLTRLCGEQGVPLALTGTSTTTMGPQGIKAFVQLLSDAEASDGGLLYDGGGPGVGYICRESRYNVAASLTLDMGASTPEVAAPFTPIDDDQRTRNDVTVTRDGGSSARVVDTTSALSTTAVGVYDTSVTLSLYNDSQPVHQAGWRVHQGTVEGLRYPSINIDLLAVPTLASSWAAFALLGRLDVSNPSSRAVQHPPDTLNLAVEGWNEVLGTFTWSAVLNCSPYAPWRVWQLDDATYGHLGFEGQYLAVGVDTTAASWSIATPAGVPLITTAGGDMPIDLNVEGEQVRITAVSGSSSPQTATVTRSVNGVVKAHAANVTISLWAPVALSL